MSLATNLFLLLLFLSLTYTTTEASTTLSTTEEHAVHLTVFHVDKSGVPTPKPWKIPYGIKPAEIAKRCRSIAQDLQHRKFSDADLEASPSSTASSPPLPHTLNTSPLSLIRHLL